MKKAVILILAFALTACTAAPTMEQLERQAMLSGDWSEVEERERVIARRASRRPQQCPPGLIAYCERQFGENRCVCTGKDAVARLFRGR